MLFEMYYVMSPYNLKIKYEKKNTKDPEIQKKKKNRLVSSA